MSPHCMQTAERVSASDLSDNYVFQRSVLAYVEAGKLLQGRVLEIGTGSGYGIDVMLSNVEKLISVDKFLDLKLVQKYDDEKKLRLLKMDVPPLTGLPDNYFDAVVSFQVIEHIKDHHAFVAEVYRVLKPGGCFIVTTPNRLKSLTRNPWHVREYSVKDLEILLSSKFKIVYQLGVFGNEKIDAYYERNRAAVQRITRFDVFNLQHRLPAWTLQIPYDILNRINRRRLLKKNHSLVTAIHMEDYYMAPANDDCFDLFYVVEKVQ